MDGKHLVVTSFRFTVYLSPTMSVAFAIMDGTFGAQPFIPVAGTVVGAAAAVGKSGVFVVAAVLPLSLGTGMGRVDSMGPAILVELTPSASGSWSFFVCVHFLAELVDFLVEFLQDCGHSMVAGAGGIRRAAMGGGERAVGGGRGGEATLDGAEGLVQCMVHVGIHGVLHLGEVVSGHFSCLVGRLRRHGAHAGVEVMEFLVEMLLESFESGVVVGRELFVLAYFLPRCFNFADGFQGEPTSFECSQGRAHDGGVLGGCLAQLDSHVSVFLRFFKPTFGAIWCAGVFPVD